MVEFTSRTSVRWGRLVLHPPTFDSVASDHDARWLSS